MSWRSRRLKSSSWRSGKELEVRPGEGGPGDGDQEAEGSEAGCPGVGTSGLVAGGGFMGVVRCPRGVEKVKVTLPSLPPPTPINSFNAFFTKSCPVAILEGQGDILVAEV